MRNTILASERYEITASRKIREMYLAYEFEKRHTKAEVLEAYLNTVYFGDGAYGAEAAALSYFGKHANKLTIGEAALLSGLPAVAAAPQPLLQHGGRQVAPALGARAAWSPTATSRRHRPTTPRPRRSSCRRRPSTPTRASTTARYFVSYVRKQLLTQYPDSLIFKGGLKVYTTIDTRLQRAAERAVKKTLPYKKDPDAALVSINPPNGNIVAMYGGRDYTKNSYNYATQGQRQPGSSFKTFVLVTALEKGIPPRRPMNASSPARIPTHPVWIVNNSEGSGKGYITISAATRRTPSTACSRA